MQKAPSRHNKTPKDKVIILSTGEKLVQQNGRLRAFQDGDLIGSVIETNPNVQLSYYHLG